MNWLDLLWLVALLPFLGAAVNATLGPRAPKSAVTAVALGAPGLSLLIALGCIWQYILGVHPAAYEQVVYAWTAGALNIDIAFQLDALSAVMLFVVTFVGFLIHVYSVGYMSHEAGFQRYFAYLNLFMGAMLLLMLGNNYLVMFIGWEGVGLCSYLLIGFWYYDQEFPPYAGRKAFIVNRIGDFAFLIGMFALVAEFGTLNYTELFGAIAADPHRVEGSYVFGMTFAGFVTLCFFIGGDGQERADSPVRLAAGRDGGPDAGLGADPRRHHGHRRRLHGGALERFALRQLAPGTSAIDRGDRLRDHGAVRGHHRSGPARHQEGPGLLDRERSSATCSWPAGVGAYSAAIFHVGTHAFFKALLFLGSGSVIHAMSGEQDMRSMGGLQAVDAGDVQDVLDRNRRDRGHAAAGRVLLQGRDPGSGLGIEQDPVGGRACSRRGSRPATCSGRST